MDKLLTVVIPAYNIEKYEEQCLSSFVKPKALPEIEVLVVNDGSSDRTVEIAEKYVQKYPDIFRVINKENGGHGSTINRGIEEARGTYFKVVDGDDWVDGAAFGKLVRFLHTAKSDFIVNTIRPEKKSWNLNRPSRESAMEESMLFRRSAERPS